MAQANLVQSGEIRPLQRLEAFVALRLEALVKYARYRQTLRELNGLTNAELADIGLSRPTLRRAALEAVYGSKEING
ncbi:uncharacterized protein DUF1127 [Rhodovulum imhoffii]|uniref:Uncharacterized protein DUF1127 n=1 Tax=Rhodovulum imhoffii TaxID=365340 RepID=A0A2T5BPJ4_9RHOB|nr:DUF1127 domain-containing protein [Rhodovulum imhoffii]MBK5932875.1 hypothetical protein [Rhodovulum imhoffii]PTN00968.1 uncharacterized protein DUF1127 [Rhodovulum imhoffii]